MLDDLNFYSVLNSFFLSSLCCFVSDEDSNLATSPMPDMDSDSMLCGPVDEEERWLDALEKGELDDNGELKKEIDESLLTARQVRQRDKDEHFSTFKSKLKTYHLFLLFFRKPCYTNSRASLSWSSPWATRRRR